MRCERPLIYGLSPSQPSFSTAFSTSLMAVPQGFLRFLGSRVKTVEKRLNNCFLTHAKYRQVFTLNRTVRVSVCYYIASVIAGRVASIALTALQYRASLVPAMVADRREWPIWGRVNHTCVLIRTEKADYNGYFGLFRRRHQ